MCFCWCVLCCIVLMLFMCVEMYVVFGMVIDELVVVVGWLIVISVVSVVVMLVGVLFVCMV